jgi:hypothetical protein
MATSETTAQPVEEDAEVRTASLSPDYHGQRGCIIRLNESQLKELGVDIRQDSVEYAVVNGELRLE